VVGVADELTGQAVNAFVSIKEGNEATDALRKEFILQVRKSIGPFAAPKAVYVVPDLPKTRSGKIMRRILRKILAGEEDQLGDISTVSDSHSVRSLLPQLTVSSSSRTQALLRRSSVLSTRQRRNEQTDEQSKGLTCCLMTRRWRTTRLYHGLYEPLCRVASTCFHAVRLVYCLVYRGAGPVYTLPGVDKQAVFKGSKREPCVARARERANLRMKALLNVI